MNPPLHFGIAQGFKSGADQPLLAFWQIVDGRRVNARLLTGLGAGSSEHAVSLPAPAAFPALARAQLQRAQYRSRARRRWRSVVIRAIGNAKVRRGIADVSEGWRTTERAPPRNDAHEAGRMAFNCASRTAF
jgi:hypothetical protein